MYTPIKILSSVAVLRKKEILNTLKDFKVKFSNQCGYPSIIFNPL